jgi:hypothetical protein
LAEKAFDLFNTQFLGVPDPVLDDIATGRFQSTAFNANGGATFAGNTNTEESDGGACSSG